LRWLKERRGPVRDNKGMTARDSIPPNIRRDMKTVGAMVRIYCRGTHGRQAELCESCAHLLGYADERLAKCPFGDEKTTCRDCPIHCYRPTERTAMKDVMRYAGPRMVWRHPLLSIRHLWLERQGAPPWPPPGKRQRRAVKV
jgi:hypothetical protein